MKNDMINDEVFCTYVQIRTIAADQAVSPPPGEFKQRWQWFILPDDRNFLQASSAPEFVFNVRRQQRFPNNQSRWSGHADRRDELVKSICLLKASTHPAYAFIMDTPLVIGMTKTELQSVMQAPDKAPWPLIKRAAKAAPSAGFVLL